MSNLFIKLKDFIVVTYNKLAKIDDTPQKVALGFGLGAFTGIMPGMGPVIAVFLAFLFRVNRAASFLGSLLTNTWISFATFLLAIKLGSAIFKVDWRVEYKSWLALLRDFHFSKLTDLSILDIILPVAIGYLIIGFLFGLLVYITALIIIKIRLRRKYGANKTDTD